MLKIRKQISFQAVIETIRIAIAATMVLTTIAIWKMDIDGVEKNLMLAFIGTIMVLTGIIPTKNFEAKDSITIIGTAILAIAAWLLLTNNTETALRSLLIAMTTAITILVCMSAPPFTKWLFVSLLSKIKKSS